MPEKISSLHILMNWRQYWPLTDVEQCNCCHKVHNAKKEELKDGAEHGKDDKKEDATKADIESPNEHGFSAEEDTVLKERKEGSPWQATMDELEKLGKTRTKSECQDRMKELKSAAVAQPDEKADSNANKDKKDDKQDLNQNKKGKQGKGKGEMTEEQKAKIEKKREEGRAKKAAEKVVDEKKEEIKDEVKAAVEAAKVCHFHRHCQYWYSTNLEIAG